MELNSDEAIEGYRLALRRMRLKNQGIAPDSPGGKFAFDQEIDAKAWSLKECIAEGKQLLDGFQNGWGLFKDVELALRHVNAAGACDDQDRVRLACLWLQAQIDQNKAMLTLLHNWGVQEFLRSWTTDYTIGRQWLYSIGSQWVFSHLPEISQLLGWANDTEWCFLNDLRHYAMQKSWDSFIDIRGSAHSIWSNSLLERKD
jgi:hypothetical protein